MSADMQGVPDVGKSQMSAPWRRLGSTISRITSARLISETYGGFWLLGLWKQIGERKDTFLREHSPQVRLRGIHRLKMPFRHGQHEDRVWPDGALY
jgi:hypothetical protein